MSTINYNNRTFISIENSKSGEVSDKTVFNYNQQGDIVWAEYEGGQIIKGTLIAKVDEVGSLNMRYQHLNKKLEFKTGKCTSTPEKLSNGKIRLHEKWQWTSGNRSSGESIIEEI